MSWRDRANMAPASFKGVRFYVDGSSVSQSRRVLVRRFAGRDGSAQQDLGRDAVELDVTAYLAGENYDQQRDELEAALSEGGPGWLRLPTRGNLWARVTRGPQTTESRDAGGYCTMRIGFVLEERSLPRTVRTRVDTPSALTASAAQLRAAAEAEFARTVSTRGLPGGYVARTQSAIDQALAIAGRVQVRASELMAPVSATARVLDATRDKATALLGLPGELATRLVDAVLSAFALADAVIAGVDALSGVPAVVASPFERGRGARLVDAAAGAFRGFGEPFVTRGDSALAQRDDANTRAVTTLVRAAALSAAAAQLAVVPYDSRDQALGILSRTRMEIDALSLTASDALFEALGDLRAALTAHLFDVGEALDPLMRCEVRAPVPALLLSYQLYGVVDLEADIIARNGISDPLRVRGVLEVIAP